MAWNIGALAVYAREDKIDEVIPDIFESGETDLFFEDVS